MDDFKEATDCSEKDDLKTFLQDRLPNGLEIKISESALEGFKKMQDDKKSWSDTIWEECSECLLSKELDTEHSEVFHLRIELWKANYGTEHGNGYLYCRIVCDKPLEKAKWRFHPFRCLKDRSLSGDKTEYGEVIADNDYARTLFDWICMEDSELEGFTGSNTPECYRARLIGQIHGLWD
jgi:hypothetical protein